MLSVAEAAPFVFISQEDLSRRPQTEGVSIDPKGSHEIDDAMWVERGVFNPAISRVQVHIANAGLLLGHKAVHVARERGWSVYHEDGLVDPMLDSDIAENDLSLDTDHFGLGTPAVTTEFTFHHDTKKVSDEMIYESRVNCRNLTYLGFKKAVSQGDPQARAIVNVARVLHAHGAGANSLRGNGMSQEVVRRFMLATNILQAQHMQRRGVPWMFRNHHLHIINGIGSEALKVMYPYSEVFAQHNLAWYAPTPTVHEGIGSYAYCHYTSPLRRFPDLVNHLNQRALELEVSVPFPEEALRDIAQDLAKKAMVSSGLVKQPA